MSTVSDKKCQFYDFIPLHLAPALEKMYWIWDPHHCTYKHCSSRELVDDHTKLYPDGLVEIHRYHEFK